MLRLILVISLLLARFTNAAEIQEAKELDRYFADAGVKGAFVLFEVDEDRFLMHDRERSGKRFVPASTFKIGNSLIALETGAVKSVDEVLPYGGKPQPYPQWEKDMGLREAIKISNVPIYQEVARRIGMERMALWLRKFDYGNMETGSVVDQFWLKGPLAISAIEQAQFLAKLAKGTLPVKPEVLAAVKEIALVEEGEGYRLYAKTGWVFGSNPQVGWWVGWIEKEGKIRTFALNMDMKGDEDGPKRLSIARACLKELGAL